MRRTPTLDEKLANHDPQHPYVILPDTTAMVDPYDPAGIEQRLRRGQATEGDLIVAASVFLSYRTLVNQSEKRRSQLARWLRRLMR